jgi:hypothetical protein
VRATWTDGEIPYNTAPEVEEIVQKK